MSTSSPAPAVTRDQFDWHRMDVEEVRAAVDAQPTGLTAPEAAARLERVGPNALEDRGSKPAWRMLYEQLTAVMVLILIGAAALSLALGKLLEAGAIGAIVILFALLGFLQESRAEKAIAALRRMAVPSVRVLRDGAVVVVDSNELVPGDVVLLEAGNVVPADLRLTEVNGLRVQEAALTGEAEAVEKHVGAVDEADLPLGDRRCMAYSGTQVTYGRGVGVVVATGMQTELGRIAGLLQDVTEEDTPLQARLDRVGVQLAALGVVVALAVMGLGALGGEELGDLLLTAISVAVAVIPEGLPAVVTFTLAIGSQRMLRRNALIRRLPAVETLGSVTVICSDKTGTLTENRMTATVLDLPDHTVRLDDPDAVAAAAADAPTAKIALAVGALCNDATWTAGASEAGHSIGDPTEVALLVAAERAGVDVANLREVAPRLGELPFDSDRKRMTTAHGPLGAAVPALSALPQDRPIAFVKGAVEGILAHTTGVQVADGHAPADELWRERIRATEMGMAADGLRVLGLAYRPLDVVDVLDHAEEDLVFVGLIGIIDPPRPQVRDAVATCRAAGIRPVMITGDHPLTAKAIAAELDISRDDRVVTGTQLAQMDAAALEEAVLEVSVFARVSPEHKLRIVEALQRQGQVAAMTGDGVNDAPALKRADIGVAMGITGTDVSKEAADMVLRDDDFSTIVAAVEEGRVIYDNLRRFVSFAVAGNLGKIIVMLGWPLPLLFGWVTDIDAIALLPLQLLWLNLMTDGLLGLAMGVEPAEPRVMRRAPHAPGASIWDGGLGRRTAWVGVLIGVIGLAVGFGYALADRPEWQAMLFTTVAFSQVVQAFAIRSQTESLRTVGLRTNPVLLGVAGLVVALQLAALYTPLSTFLGLEPLGAVDLLISVASAMVVFLAIEAAKARGRRASAR